MFFKHSVVLFFAITSCYSKVQINIILPSNKVNSAISYFGTDDKIVTEQEVRLFNITGDNLKRGFKIELGKEPDDIFLKNPTPYHNLFKKYKWMEMNRRIRVKSAEVFDIVKENIILVTHRIINNTTGRIKKKVGLREVVENRLSCSWLDKRIPDDDIFYKINMTCDYQSFIFENRWRRNDFRSVTLTFGITNIGYIFLNQGQIVNIELTAVKTILLLKVDYVAELIGSVIGNYAKLYGKYHFWAPSVVSIMQAAKLKNEIITTELIEISYYANPNIKIVDKYTLDPVPVTKLPTPFHSKKPDKI